jgi:hypothetical protein
MCHGTLGVPHRRTSNKKDTKNMMADKCWFTPTDEDYRHTGPVTDHPGIRFDWEYLYFEKESEIDRKYDKPDIFGGFSSLEEVLVAQRSYREMLKSLDICRSWALTDKEIQDIETQDIETQDIETIPS